MTAVMEATQVQFQGFSAGTEIWGATQANFLIKAPERHEKEAAILLNDPAAKLLGEATGHENTPEFREDAARIAGGIVFRDVVDRDQNIDSIVMVSNLFFEQHPALLEQIRAALS